MLTIPAIFERQAEPYVAVRLATAMADLPRTVGPKIDAIGNWVRQASLPVAGPLFFRYVVIDMAGLLQLEIGFPTAHIVPAEDGFIAGTLPGGRFAGLTYRGPYEGLYDANAVLVGWAKERGVRFDAVPTPEGDRFACRLEIYRTDPGAEPDPSNWVTELAFRIAD